MNFLKISFFLAFTILLQGLSISQEWVSYQSQQQINDLVDTGDELHIATDAGLVVVNKSTLEKTFFNKTNSDLSNQHINTITLDPEGNSWIGTYDVILGRFDGSGFQETIVPDHEAYNENTELYDFKIAPNGDFWLGTNDGVFHKQGETWFNYQDEISESLFKVWDIEIDSNGDIFIASNDVYKYSNGVWSSFSETEVIQAYLDADLFFSNSGDLYLAGDLDKIGHFDGQQWQTYDLDPAFNGSEVIRLAEDTNGSIYFNTRQNGVYKLEGTTFRAQADTQAEAFDNRTSYIHIDEQNNQWLNYNIHLSVNRSGAIASTIISQHTLETNGIDNVSVDNNGNRYFTTTSEENISVFAKDGTWSFLPYPSDFIDFERINDILSLANDNIWMATNRGLHNYNGSEWTFNDFGSCNKLAIDSQGKIYFVVANSAIYIMENGNLSEYNTTNSPLTSLIISGLGVDPNDNLWISSFTWEGDSEIQNVSNDGTWTTYLDEVHPTINHPTGDFHFDVNGNVWVPINSAGALKFDGNSWTNPYTGNFDLIEELDVESIESDATGKMYFAYSNGVTTLYNNVWEDLPIEDVRSGSSATTEIQFDNEGTLWWASNRFGVFAYTVGIINSTSTDFESIASFSVYPNPAKDFTVIDFSLKEKASARVNIYNQLGQLQSKFDLGELPDGSFQQRIELNHFSKGYYLIQLEVNNKFSTKKIIIQ